MSRRKRARRDGVGRDRSRLVVTGEVVVSIFLVQFSGTLAHTYLEFYYLFGGLTAVVVSVSDYLHHVAILGRESDAKKAGESVATDNGAGGQKVVRTAAEEDEDKRLLNIALQAAHRKWTSILGYSLTLIGIILGTIAFSAVSSFGVIFGDSFTFAPSVGVAFGMAFLALIFAGGVIGNIRKILVEIETTIATLRKA